MTNLNAETEFVNLMTVGSAALRKAAVSDQAKQYILGNNTLYQLFSKAAHRYVAGETLEDAIARAAHYNRQGLAASIEFMGENVGNEQEAVTATGEFLAICENIASNGLTSSVSLDLSHIGLALSRELCQRHLDQICQKAKESGIEVMISAEDAGKTDDVLDMYLGAAGRHENLGITLQAYLHRTKEDFKKVVEKPNRIRLVKGAFQTEEGLSLPRGAELNRTYLGYLDLLLTNHHKCSIATHDPLIQQEAGKLISQHQMPGHLYEFESLLGIATNQLNELMQSGHPAKIYIVYGHEWYLYLCNRIAENPMSIFLALEDMVQN
ncbi:proline dehydrogenase family protein [Dyadobacter sp. CY261]|uniref:proline dehydrogenase family protein n=1 Tax=Dyadobacter sp. CY261 TaxID=2907203 RepID=UPI001F392FC9|nr:proline dehydrogenase family protein [Dyadobacter sp. CY261]MCF0072825.1 proline dehydrogenase family protein [Dyadobacter sp. CY261]